MRTFEKFDTGISKVPQGYEVLINQDAYFALAVDGEVIRDGFFGYQDAVYYAWKLSRNEASNPTAVSE
jgi:hypothetical protein